MIGSLEKGITAAKLATPAQGSFEGVDLRVLPKYISFRAALLHSRLTHQYVNLLLCVLLVTHYVITRFEVHSLHTKIREKEYILAPGVQNFTPAAVNAVTESYVQEAIAKYLSDLGNFTASSVDEQYVRISKSMSPKLRVKFLTESAEERERVKAENLSEFLTITNQEIIPSGDGYFKVTALARRERYINNEYAGAADEVIEMHLQLVSPREGLLWFLQINALKRGPADTFRARGKF